MKQAVFTATAALAAMGIVQAVGANAVEPGHPRRAGAILGDTYYVDWHGLATATWEAGSHDERLQVGLMVGQDREPSESYGALTVERADPWPGRDPGVTLLELHIGLCGMAEPQHAEPLYMEVAPFDEPWPLGISSGSGSYPRVAHRWLTFVLLREGEPPEGYLYSQWREFDITPLVDYWDQGHPNYGLRLRLMDGMFWSAHCDFDSTESTFPPRLTTVYQDVWWALLPHLDRRPAGSAGPF